ncbi:MAG: hydantoinase/oxoprolinase family protein [Deltaproteobacteria bacterium]|nr:hydantoinase/oxoprolinase family protein [Deltaproteobacteria bacterium]
MIIGLDVGGTYTDVVLLGDEGIVRAIKVLTDAKALFKTVLSGLDIITEGIPPENIRRIVLSTTLTTNAIAQAKISDVGMIVSGGPGIDPELYRTHPHYVSVCGSIDHRGREIEPVNTCEIEEFARQFAAIGIRHVGVVGKFSTRNPQHEMLIYERIQPYFEKVFMGHQISGNLNFPRRIATTYLNAAVFPIHKQFFEAVQQSLEKKGLRIPIHIMKADGGTMNFAASMGFPAQTILSGPAASVMGSLAFAFDDEESLVMDIGGTTTDMAILVNHVPVLNPLGICLGPYKTLIRSLESHSIPVGGDSRVSIQEGRIHIGPERMGPAMAYGGSVPTPTDALCVMGKLKSGDKEKSVQGFCAIAHDLGCSIEDAAVRVFDHTCRTILKEACVLIDRINQKPVYTIHELQEGYRVNPQKILILGGPAPYFAQHFEKISGFRVGVVPRWDVANAIGAALARTTCEVSLFADTQQGIAMAPEEAFTAIVTQDFSNSDAVQAAGELLEQKAVRQGASREEIEIEVVENQQFNMVKGFYTVGKNIRVKVQIKPGLIDEYDTIAGILSTE